jgi:misacylated tRNA(Ala) deacylase
MTEPLFRTDAYLRSCVAKVLDINERGGIVLDRTVFYPSAGGQPGDCGALEADGSPHTEITTTVYDANGATIVHVPSAGIPLPAAGQTLRAVLNWETRWKHMRMHTALHLLSSLVRFPVTGGQIGANESRLDFDITDASAVDKDELTAALNELVAADYPVTERWISVEELDANPQLVRTMAVKPPRGAGKVRLVLIGCDGAVDRQPCGGTHVKSTGEIGRLAVTKIEKKGRQNRRIRVAWA